MQFPYRLIDLTHELSQETVSWDGGCGFTMTTSLDYDDCTDGFLFRVQDFTMYAGMGTHIDAPAHCLPGGQTIESLPLESLVSKCFVIDVSANSGPTYSVSANDILEFEKTNGSIEPESFVVIHTGWAARWDNNELYRNEHVFPSVSLEAAELLNSRGIFGLGIDTLSPDRPSDGFGVHKLLLGAGRYIVENIANADKLTATGSFVMVLPIKIKGATEAPARIVGLVSI